MDDAMLPTIVAATASPAANSAIPTVTTCLVPRR